MDSTNDKIQIIKDIANGNTELALVLYKYPTDDLRVIRDSNIQESKNQLATPVKGLGTKVAEQNSGLTIEEEIYDYQKVKKALHLR